LILTCFTEEKFATGQERTLGRPPLDAHQTRVKTVADARIMPSPDHLEIVTLDRFPTEAVFFRLIAEGGSRPSGSVRK
jgi:hypothetical protein